jgi:SAM-dependent methyltransferase
MNIAPAQGRLDKSAMLVWASEYATAFQGIERLLTAYRPHVCPFERLVDAVPARANVLDIGCGNGLFLFMLARAGRLDQGCGVDIRDGAVNAGNAALRGFGIEGALLRVAGGPNGWPRQTFDTVSMIDVMHHLPPGRQHSTLAAACALVRPGGLLVYKDMATAPLWAAWANRLHDLALAQQWIHYLPIGDIETVAAGCGMRPIHGAALRLGWYAHELRFFRRE